ncbi:MAG: hypothetical protein Edafosvirus33_6 [Edafosvirus sp.]|uniref:Uncharacterized protein n=1 Tax=Edafosvirus sp. TaxID=2487765 RepID=A0A3G4ZV66_9VIRU|nr:MAG: hypothetical protein Edafosvirus33_6 [Edafosvirus sp.]
MGNSQNKHFRSDEIALQYVKNEFENNKAIQKSKEEKEKTIYHYHQPYNVYKEYFRGIIVHDIYGSLLFHAVRYDLYETTKFIIETCIQFNFVYELENPLNYMSGPAYDYGQKSRSSGMLIELICKSNKLKPLAVYMVPFVNPLEHLKYEEGRDDLIKKILDKILEEKKIDKQETFLHYIEKWNIEMEYFNKLIQFVVNPTIFFRIANAILAKPINAEQKAKYIMTTINSLLNNSNIWSTSINESFCADTVIKMIGDNFDIKQSYNMIIELINNPKFNLMCNEKVIDMSYIQSKYKEISGTNFIKIVRDFIPRRHQSQILRTILNNMTDRNYSSFLLLKDYLEDFKLNDEEEYWISTHPLYEKLVVMNYINKISSKSKTVCPIKTTEDMPTVTAIPKETNDVLEA